ncbi:DNA polymerase IV, partial [Candidatus Aerophobetes bacterium]|nr:DNA polymerase IV [Candidatus Aerophobetes bacterium]
TASYEARAFGVQSAQPIARARKLCPQGVFLRVRMDRYREISRRVLKILSSCTPKVEPVSIDEAFLDITGCEKLFGKAEDIAREIKTRIKTEVGLTCSLGVAPNKFLAKVASGMQKPDGLVIVKDNDKESFLANLPVGKIWGVGKVTQRELQQMGIYTIRQLGELSFSELQKTFGRIGARLYNLSHGIDRTPVLTDRKIKSMSSETTFPHDISERKVLEKTLYELSVKVSKTLRNKGLGAKSIQLKVRFSDFTTFTRSHTYGEATSLTEFIWQRAKELLDKKVDLSSRKVRLIGLAVFNLGAQRQMELFVPEKMQRLEVALEKIEKKYGIRGIRKGRTL